MDEQATPPPTTQVVTMAPAPAPDKASSPFIWPPVLFAIALVIASFLAWALPWWLVPAGFAGFLVRLAGIALVVAGIWSTVNADRRFKRAGTPTPPTKPTTSLVTEGVFSRTRNPMYLGMATVLFGLAFLVGSVWYLVATPLFMLAVQKLAIEREERYLGERFGEAYARYRDSVRRWL